MIPSRIPDIGMFSFASFALRSGDRDAWREEKGPDLNLSTDISSSPVWSDPKRVRKEEHSVHFHFASQNKIGQKITFLPTSRGSARIGASFVA